MFAPILAFLAPYKTRLIFVAVALVAALGITIAVTVDLRHREAMAAEIASLKTKNQALTTSLTACAANHPKWRAKYADPALEKHSVFGWHRS